MELTAAIEGLSALKERCSVTLFSESKYFIDAVTQGWAGKWRANGWMRTKNDKALNSDLWEILLDLLDKHKVELVWV